jgi:hypothetical protein
MADGVEEMGLPQPHASVEEEGVISLGRLASHGIGGGMGQAVAIPHDEGFKGISGVKGERR